MFSSIAKSTPSTTATTDKVKDIEDHYAAEREKPESTTREQQVALIKAENKELRVARFDGVMAMVKMFGGPVFVLAVGCGLIIKGHQVLKMQNAVLGAALKGLEKTFDFYRRNVIAEQGEEADQRYLHGVSKPVEIETVGHDECGNEIIKKETVPMVQTDNPWIFEYTPQYFLTASGIPDRDLTHLANVEDHFRRIYDTYKKHDDISMFEVLEYLQPNWDALDPTGERKNFCRIFGWGHDRRGDDRIDLGRYNPVNDPARRGISDKVYIVMNCDGRLSKLVNQYKERYVLK